MIDSTKTPNAAMDATAKARKSVSTLGRIGSRSLVACRTVSQTETRPLESDDLTHSWDGGNPLGSGSSNFESGGANERGGGDDAAMN
jgi:hypothetical protein